MEPLSRALAHQDAAGMAGAPYGVCLNGRVVRLIPAGTDVTDREVIAGLRHAAANAIGVLQERLEILVTCHNHPQSSAVDCLDCVPE